MAQQTVTELDFDDIKANLKVFLESQTEFSDWNFEGSGLNAILDLLAYNTHYNGVIAHMLANESFLDSAIKRESVASLAKAIGYTPRSRRSSTAKLNVVITPPSSYTSTTLTLSRNTIFTSTVDGVSYTFYPAEDVVATKSGTTFTFNDLEVKEGVRVASQFAVAAGNEQGPYVIPNPNIDTTSLRVRVQTSLADLTLTSYNVSSTILDVKTDSKIFWIEEGTDGLYQLRFGDDTLGKKLSKGNLIRIDYLNTTGDTANGCKTFSCSSVISGGGEIITITTAANAGSGSLKEKIDEIRFNAPKYNATKDRAVTSSDYESLILASNSSIQSVSVWGGEQNDPPMHGKVFISLNPVTGSIITDAIKDNIRNTIITPKAAVAIQPEFVDPEYTYIGLEINSVYNPKETLFTAGEIGTTITTAVNNYFTNTLNKLNKSFYYSKLHDLINDSSDAILSTNLQIRLQKRPSVDLGVSKNYTVKFNTKLQPREITSTYFDLTLEGTTQKVSLQDVPASSVVAPLYNGTGTINAIQADGTVVGAIGTVDYDSGTISIPSTVIKSLYGTETKLRINAVPHDSIKDVTTQALIRTSDTSTAAVVAKASRNTVLSLDDSSLNSTTGEVAGLTVLAKPEVAEI